MASIDRVEAKKHFDSFDKDGSGSIDADEVAAVLKSIGEAVSPSIVQKLISEVDTDKSGTIDFEEFCVIYQKSKSGKSEKGFADVVVKNANLNVVQSVHATHSFSDEEKASFVDYINDVLKDDADLKHLGFPLNPDTDALFKAVRDGQLMCKLINTAIKGTIDERAINKGNKLNTFKITENQNLCINSAKGIGCNVVNVGGSDLMEGKVHLVLGLIWQIIRIGLMAAINLKNHPYLVRLLEPGETLEDLLKLSPEQILIRWVNYHLKNSGSARRISNFGGDIKDSEVYTLLLNQLAPKQCDKKALQESDRTKRAELVLGNAEKIGCRKFVKARDIVAGNPKLNLAFVANLFNTCPGLEPVEEVIEIIEETREEKAFRNWMNSLGVDPYVNHLYEDLRDGIILLQLFDKIEPGSVDWKRVNTVKPLNKFKQVENCNYAIDIGKKLKMSLIATAGSDINAANKTLTLGLVWQMMRYYVLNYLRQISKGKPLSEADIVNWANHKAKQGGKHSKMESFQDKTLSDSLFIIDVLSSCQSESVNYDLVTPGKTDEEKMLNAQYAISCARKMGAAVFLLWEDIVEVKPKMLLTFFAAVMNTFGGI